MTTWRQLYYDDAATLGARYDLVNRARLRGVGIWALGYDGARPELYRALAAKFLKDTTAPAAGIVALSATQPDEGFAVRWTAEDDWNGVASYDVQVSADGGAWTAWLLRHDERRAPSTSAPTTTATRSGFAPATARATCPRGTWAASTWRRRRSGPVGSSASPAPP